MATQFLEHHLQKIGINRNDAESIAKYVTRGLIGALDKKEVEVYDATRNLEDLANKVSIDEKLNIDKPTYSISEALSQIRTIAKRDPRIIGLCGVPGSGKTTMLDMLKNDFSVIDEFWEIGAPKENNISTYKDLVSKVCETVIANKSSIVAAARLDLQLVDMIFYLELHPRQRLKNIQKRLKDNDTSHLDSLTIRFPEYFALADKFRYETQKPFCDAIVRTDLISY